MTINGPIAIDGPAASGKSTVGRGVAAHLGWTFIDTGLLYRAVGLLALRADLALWDDATVSALASGSEIRMNDAHVSIDGEDVSEVIRSAEVAAAASRVAVLSGVRRVLVAMQRRMADQEDGRVVMVGRDIGTVVLWDAPVKVYLDASPEARAQRRYVEERARGGDSSYEEVLANLRARDRRDEEREDSPSRPAADAHVLVTDTLSVDEVIGRVVELAGDGGDGFRLSPE